MIPTRICCDGYIKRGNLGCVLNTTGKTSPCGNFTCAAVPDAHCAIFKKCGKEIGLFMHKGSIATQCHESGAADLLSCSGGCVSNPCANATCSAFQPSEVFCFPSGCNCQPTWIRLQDKTEINCLSGETISKEESYRKRRQTCNNL